MQPGDIIALGAMVVAVVAAVVSVFQVVEARRARSDAQTARDEAKADADRTAEAAERDAAANERLAAATEEANRIATAYRDPWVVEMDYSRPAVRVFLKNAGSEHLENVVVTDEAGDLTPYTENHLDYMAPNQSLVFDYERTLTSPGSTEIKVTWRRPGETIDRTWLETIS